MKVVALRRSLCVALLVALALPWVVTVGIAIHEAEHHAEHDHGESSLLVLVHGHHHDHAVQDHEHPAAPRARGESRLEGPGVVVSSAAVLDSGILWESTRADLKPPQREPPSSSRLCTWRL